MSTIKQWPYSSKVFITHPGEKREAPEPGEIFVQKDLLATLTKMVEAEEQALKQNKSRKERSMRRTIDFIKVILLRNSFVVVRNRADL